MDIHRFALAALLCCAPAFAADPPDTMAQRLVACTSCHAKKEGGDAYFPRIHGKPAGYLFNQMSNFRDGRRQYPLMTYMVERLPESYMREIADYLSAEHLPPPKPQASDLPAAALARGHELATKGDAALKIPACMACHGSKLTGTAPSIPGLVGLPRDYLNAQFGAWRTGTRRAHAPDCMADIANKLSQSDVAAVAGWLAAQTVPADPSPAASVARPLPLACGSAPEPKP